VDVSDATRILPAIELKAISASLPIRLAEYPLRWRRGAGSFWSGLTDDIRVYDRLVKP
jgi:hypothetical protein